MAVSIAKNSQGETVLEPELLTAPTALAPDFTIFTEAAVLTKDLAALSAGEIVPIRMVGSSTIKDMQGDTMALTALQDMAKAQPGLAIWLNHDYTLPGSLFGSLNAAPIITQQGNLADIAIEVLPNKINPNALQTYEYIKDGKTRLGCSVGCVVEEYEIADEDSDDEWASFFAPINILRVQVVEWSVVGVPANQRCWVENALKGVFTRTLDSRLAPAVKTLWPHDYNDIVRSIPNADHRKYLASAPVRQDKRRTYWNPNNGEFAVMENRQVKSIAPKALDSLINKSIENRPLPVVTKGACGKTSWPLADREKGWDGGGAKGRLFDWAGGDDFSAAKAKQVFFWVDDSDTSLKGSYKLPFCDVIDGSVKAIPKGIEAVAGALQGARSELSIPDADKASIKSKVATYYHKMAQEFGDDSIKPPWEDEKEDSMDPTVVKESDPNHGPVDEDTDHSHSHDANGSQGGDSTHTHTHFHKAGTNSHDHQHVDPEAEKAAEPKGPKDPKDPDGDGDDDTNPKDDTDGDYGSGDGKKGLDAEEIMRQISLLTSAADVALARHLSDAMAALKSAQAFVTKAGREFSQENTKTMQSIHDMLKSMNPGVTCAATEQDMQQNVDSQGGANPEDASKMLELMQNSLGELAAINKSVAGLGTHFPILKSESDAISLKLTAAGKLLDAQAIRVKKLDATVANVAQKADELQHMPLGQPTHIHRTVEKDPTAARYEDFLSPEIREDGNAQERLKSAQAQTRVQYKAGVGQCTVWPKGVGVGVRPELLPEQIVGMSSAEIAAYHEGDEALVPIV